MSTADQSVATDRTAIGCVLPLTGRHAVLGNRILEAIVLAGGFFDASRKTPFRLVMEDSESRPEGAKDAVARLAQEGRVIAILGPLSNAEAAAAAEEAQRLSVPIVTLTQGGNVTGVGSYVFRFQLSALAQIRTLVRYALSEKGLRSFTVLYPGDGYGQEMAKLFQDEVLKGGGKIRRVASYDKAGTDLDERIRDMAGLPPLLGEGDVVEEAKPQVDFAALFIPDAAPQISLIASQIAFHGITGIQLLGTGAWNSAELLREGGEFLEGAIFVDAFYPDGASPAVSDFVDAFYSAYDREPEMMEAVAYDAAILSLRIMAAADVKTRDQFRDALLRMKDFTGVTGNASFSAGRDVRKDAFVLTVRDGRIVRIK